MKNTIYRNTKILYLSYIWFKSTIFAWVLAGAYLISNGVSIQDVAIIFVICSWLNIILEVPTGILADMFDRKKLLIIAPLITSLRFPIFIFADNSVALYILGFFFWVLGRSIVSGTLEAYLYDTLDSINKKHKYYKISMYGYTCGCVAATVSVIFGGFIAEISEDLVTIISAIPLVLASIVAIFFVKDLPESRKSHSQDEFNFEVEDFRIHFKNIVKTVKTNASFRYLVVFYSLMASLYAISDDFNTVIYQIFDFEYKYFGFFEATSYILSAIFAIIIYRLKFLNIDVLGTVIGLMIFAPILVVSDKTITILIFITTLAFLDSLLIRTKAEMQELIPSKSRATLLSFNVFSSNILISLVLMFSGHILEFYSVDLLFKCIFGIILFAVFISLGFAIREKCLKN